MSTEQHGAPQALVDRLARADVKARLFGGPAESARIGRFAVLRRIGAGGMGVVYAAYDEELDRKVAIKLVRPGRGDPDTRARSRREAQALARLSHPNVVQVYEVGEYEGQVYLAMEHVQGQTLRAWQASAPRGWRELVAMYLQVGRGLAAAHARGLVHRDFKPDNVLVGDDDQRPRVLDFGLVRVRARAAHDEAPPPEFTPPDLSAPPATPPGSGPPLGLASTVTPERADLPLQPDDLQPASHQTPGPDAPPPPNDLSLPPAPLDSTVLHSPAPPNDLSLPPAPLASTVLHSPAPPNDLSLPPAPLASTVLHSPAPAAPLDEQRLTVPGAVLGTPAYMAPEQLAGGEADTRSDVFSFCVALYESLLRMRPFAGDRSDTLLAAVRRGELARPEHTHDVPAWLLKIVERGLHADPAARWPAMDPLLAALAHDPTRLRRRLALAALLVGLAVAGVFALLEWRDRRQADELAAQQTRVADVEAALDRARVAADAEQQRGEARRLAIDAELAADADPILHLLLAVEAVRVHADAGAPPIPEAEQALRNALGNVTSTPYVRDPGHPAAVDAVAESPDGRWFAAGTRSGHVTLWSTADPHRPVALLPAGAPVLGLDFSPDGARLAALRDEPGGPYVWTLPPAPVPAASPPLTAPAPSDSRTAGLSAPVRWDSPVADLRDLAWSPDGAALLARSGAVAVILRADAPARVLRGHSAAVRRAVWHPRGEYVLTASADRSARLWPTSGAPPKIIKIFAGPLWSAAFSPDGDRFALASADHTAALVPTRGGPAVRLRGHDAAVLAVAFADDQVVTVSDDDSARVWDEDGGSARVALPGHADIFTGVKIAEGADLLLGTPSGGLAWVWQRSRPGPPLALHGHNGSVVAARFARGGRHVLTGSTDGSARVWHLDDDPAVLRGHDAGIELAAFAPDGDRIVTAAMDGTVRVWPRDGGPARLLRGHREGSSVTAAFSPDGAHLASAGSDGLARLWSLAGPVPALLATLPAEADREHGLGALAWHPRGDSLALAADDGRVFVVRLADHRPVRTDILTGAAGPTHALAFSADGNALAAAGDDASVRVWRLADPPVLTDVLTGHARAIRDLSFVGDLLVSAGDDATARVWTATPRVLRGHLRPVSRVRVHPDRRTLLTASADGTARIWPETGAPIVLTGHTDAVWLAEWSPAGDAVLTASADGTARLWRRQGAAWTPFLLPQAGAPGDADRTLWTGGFSPDGRLALLAGADAIARVFPVPLADMLAEACRRAGRDLDRGAWTRSMGARRFRPTCPK
ncbi:MAG: protein kinase [Myxococcales bacterium]|nr:protein kinase [Myxococcales bacterium]